MVSNLDPALHPHQLIPNYKLTKSLPNWIFELSARYLRGHTHRLVSWNATRLENGFDYLKADTRTQYQQFPLQILRGFHNPPHSFYK